MPIIASIIAFLVLLIAAVGGYVSNLATVIDLFAEPLTGEVILRTVGVVVMPLGAILGWI